MTANAWIVPIGYKEGSVWCDANVCWSEPLIEFTHSDVFDRSGIASTIWFGDVGSNDVGARIAVDHLIAEFFGEQVAFVDCDSGRRASARDQDIGYDAWVVEVPVSARNLGLPIGAFDLPARAVGLVRIPVVTELHHVVDACCSIAVIIVVRLPKRSERVDGNFVVVSEVMTEHFHIAQIFVASKHHSLTIGFAGVVDFSAPTIFDGVAVGVA